MAKAFVPHIQNPKVPRQRFDLIAAPLHDGYTGANVINTFGAVHSVTPKRPAEAAQSFAARIEPLPRPRIAVLLGGDSAAFIPATADAIVTTEDSVNMVTKATGTGKPVYVQRLKGSSTGSAASMSCCGSAVPPAPLPAKSNRGPTFRSTTPSSWPPPCAAPSALKPLRKLAHDGPRVAKRGH